MGLQAGSLVGAQAATQQLPEPVMSHTSELQSSFSVQGPMADGARQLPALQEKPLKQSLLAWQLLKHPTPPPTHRVLPGQGALAAAHDPFPSQLKLLSKSSAHVFTPHMAPATG